MAISPEGTPSFDMDKIIRRKNRTVKKLTSGVKMRLTSSGITIVEGTAVLNGETDGMIRIQCGNALFTVKRPPLYRLRNGNPSNQGTFGYRLLDFAGSARQQRTS